MHGGEAVIVAGGASGWGPESGAPVVVAGLHGRAGEEADYVVVASGEEDDAAARKAVWVEVEPEGLESWAGRRRGGGEVGRRLVPYLCVGDEVRLTLDPRVGYGRRGLGRMGHALRLAAFMGFSRILAVGLTEWVRGAEAVAELQALRRLLEELGRELYEPAEGEVTGLLPLVDAEGFAREAAAQASRRREARAGPGALVWAGERPTAKELFDIVSWRAKEGPREEHQYWLARAVRQKAVPPAAFDMAAKAESRREWQEGLERVLADYLPAFPGSEGTRKLLHALLWRRDREVGEAAREWVLALHRRGKAPRISLVTPSFNQAQYLEETIESVLGQGYPNLEYMILDGGSTDGSVEIIKRHENHLAWWRSAKDDGQYAAVDEGLKRSTGEIMGWLNSDDLHRENALFVVAALFAMRRDVAWITGRPDIRLPDGTVSTVHRIQPFCRTFYFENGLQAFIQQEGTFWRRSLWEQAGGYVDGRLRYAGDFELWMRFFRHAHLHRVDFSFAIFRRHGEQKTAQMDAYRREAEEVLRREKKLYDEEGGWFDAIPPRPIRPGVKGGKPVFY
ncbi:MAG: glycosyltransferase [Deltaproteobacteria bacterium]|nr:MAG: glycosyltransferase [Deltaproteobacteria bacterium]